MCRSETCEQKKFDTSIFEISISRKMWIRMKWLLRYKRRWTARAISVFDTCICYSFTSLFFSLSFFDDVYILFAKLTSKHIRVNMECIGLNYLLNWCQLLSLKIDITIFHSNIFFFIAYKKNAWKQSAEWTTHLNMYNIFCTCADWIQVYHVRWSVFNNFACQINRFGKRNLVVMWIFTLRTLSNVI